ncbi:MAG: GNAT family N-acetyltransferase [Patescibacteria group bacterium]|nr:GNAT family N-acetyltransferase [Patescibacteria group bacterium]
MLKPGKIIAKNTINEREYTFRSPHEGDLTPLQSFINNLSQERTFLRFQGEQVTLEEEKQYLDDQLEKISKHRSLVILAVHQGQIVGSTDIKLGEKTERHIGLFGIAINKEHRNFGLGTFLIGLVLQEAKKELPGFEIIKLSVHASNQRALHLYQKMGFERYGYLAKGVKLEDGYRDAVLMQREA